MKVSTTGLATSSSMTGETDHGVKPAGATGSAPGAPVTTATPLTGRSMWKSSGWTSPPSTTAVEVVKDHDTGPPA